MEKKITIYDLSRILGIAPSTINRAIYGKPRVSEKTRQMVLEAAEKYGFKPNQAAKSLSRKPIKIGLIANSDVPAYHNELLRGVYAASDELSDFNVALDYYMPVRPMHLRRLEILDKMEEMAAQGISGIIIQHTQDTRGYCKIISGLKEKGIPVVTIVSDIEGCQRIFNVRVNGWVAGRMAAELLSRFMRRNTCAIFTGFKDVAIHAETADGFIDGMKCTSNTIIGFYECQDDPEIAYFMADKLLNEHPDIGGVYINSSNSASICKKIKEKGYAGRLSVVASDIFPELADYIEEGVVQASIFQDPFQQGYLAFRNLYEFIAGSKEGGGEILIKPQIIIKSNLDLFR
ncbi:MAG: LacI family DNA-binding transcriptional regulator [Clostridia bacterium]|nr:LacI family DNA-binding transcriptional regulator [Clostridia bacterium]